MPLFLLSAIFSAGFPIRPLSSSPTPSSDTPSELINTPAGCRNGTRPARVRTPLGSSRFLHLPGVRLRHKLQQEQVGGCCAVLRPRPTQRFQLVFYHRRGHEAVHIQHRQWPDDGRSQRSRLDRRDPVLWSCRAAHRMHACIAVHHSLSSEGTQGGLVRPRTPQHDGISHSSIQSLYLCSPPFVIPRQRTKCQHYSERRRNNGPAS